MSYDSNIVTNICLYSRFESRGGIAIKIIELKSVLFLIAIGGIASVHYMAIPSILKSVLFLCMMMYILKYCWDSYIEFQVDHPDFINEGVDKRKARKNKKV